MGRSDSERERDREHDRERERERERDKKPLRNKSRSGSRSDSIKRRRQSDPPRKEKERDRDTNDKRGNESSSHRNSEKYYRKSRSPRMRYRKKTSRDNSAENQGNVLYISNISKRVKDEELREAFSKFGKLSSANIVRDPFTKESRGFGFVTFESEKESQEAIEMLNKTKIDERQINVEVSKRNKPHVSTPGVYLGPSTTSSLNTHSTRRYSNYSPKRRYRSRSRSRSRSNNRDRERYNRKPNNYSRSRSGSNRRR